MESPRVLREASPAPAARLVNGAGDWRAAAYYAALAGIDRAGLMWEWLRRDPGYIAWYTRASTATRGAEALDWGLHFRRGSRPQRPWRARHLAR